ncbi:MAG TPA: competence/damage-inducible protein A [Candidatus Binatia bacterium]|nr:competence/damage-inducible protein A [Candidatus Binatia bacterium]
MIETAVIISTGDELTTGKVVDTNSTFIADRLFALGIRVAAVMKVGDDRESLLWALRQAKELGDIVIGTGGLGPTADDLTTEMVAEFLGVKIILDDGVAAALKARFEKRGVAFTQNNFKQAVFPAGAVIIVNPNGTAPGFRVDLGQGKELMWLSGVPHEMRAMLRESVLPRIIEQNGGQSTIHEATFKIHGITESKLDDLMKPLDFGNTAKLAFRAHFPDLTLRLTVSGGAAQVEKFTALRSQIEIILQDFIYADSELTMEEVVGRLLLYKQLTLALAESCTGGLISHRITRVAGSSAYFLGAAITYSNAEKIRALGVNPETLARAGAVSRETALEMSRGIRQRTGADIGLSVTGVAGPSGGSPDKPVGTVWVSICQDNFHQAKLLNLMVLTDRERIVQGTAQASLNWLRQRLSRE